MARRLHPIAIAAGIAAAFYLLRPKNADAASSALMGPQPLFSGVPYLFLVRMPPDGSQDDARAFLATKAATMVVFSPTDAGDDVVSFRVVPAGDSVIERGKPFYDLGTLETVARLDGRPFAQRPAR